jgi:hypothetical protein
LDPSDRYCRQKLRQTTAGISPVDFNVQSLASTNRPPRKAGAVHFGVNAHVIGL